MTGHGLTRVNTDFYFILTLGRIRGIRVDPCPIAFDLKNIQTRFVSQLEVIKFPCAGRNLGLCSTLYRQQCLMAGRVVQAIVPLTRDQEVMTDAC